MSEYYFEHNFEGLEFELDGKFYYLFGEADCQLEDNSFDYAGTHCTGGRDGTHDPGDSVEVVGMRLDVVNDENDKPIEITADIIDEVQTWMNHDEGMQEGMLVTAMASLEADKESAAADRYDEMKEEGRA